MSWNPRQQYGEKQLDQLLNLFLFLVYSIWAVKLKETKHIQTFAE